MRKLNEPNVITWVFISGKGRQKRKNQMYVSVRGFTLMMLALKMKEWDHESKNEGSLWKLEKTSTLFLI